MAIIVNNTSGSEVSIVEDCNGATVITITGTGSALSIDIKKQWTKLAGSSDRFCSDNPVDYSLRGGNHYAGLIADLDNPNSDISKAVKRSFGNMTRR